MDVAAYIAPRLGKAQRRVILSLSNEWGEASSHQTARRMFCGVTDCKYQVVAHKRQTDNCWRLTDIGQRVKAILEAQL